MIHSQNEGSEDCNHDWSIFPDPNRSIWRPRLMARASRRTIGSTGSEIVVQFARNKDRMAVQPILWSCEFPIYQGAYVRSKVQFRILGIHLGLQISRPPRHFGFISTVPWLCAVRIVYTLMLSVLKRPRSQRRSSSYEGSLAPLPHQRLGHHSPKCHRSQRGFAIPPQLQVDWLCRVRPMYSLTIASLHGVLHPTAED